MMWPNFAASTDHTFWDLSQHSLTLRREKGSGLWLKQTKCISHSDWFYTNDRRRGISSEFLERLKLCWMDARPRAFPSGMYAFHVPQVPRWYQRLCPPLKWVEDVKEHQEWLNDMAGPQQYTYVDTQALGWKCIYDLAHGNSGGIRRPFFSYQRLTRLRLVSRW